MTTLASQQVASPSPTRSESSTGVFHDPVESEFYAQGVRNFLLRGLSEDLRRRPIAELGSGTGEAISTVLAEVAFAGEVHGYEIQEEACNAARSLTQNKSVPQYRVFNEDFFAVARKYVTGCAISNPPYLPARDNKIIMPELWGGPDGSRITRKLISCGFRRLVITVSSFSNPLATIAWAVRRKYKVTDFAITTMHFGPYSSEPKVQAEINRLRREQPPKAFTTENRYCLACVSWAKDSDVDLTDGLRAAITSLAPDPHNSTQPSHRLES